VRAALLRLYTACPTGAIQLAGRSESGTLEEILMAKPLELAATSLDASTTLFGRVTSVVSTRSAYQITLKPRDGSARVDLFTDNDLLAERAAQLFNQDARVDVRYALSVDDKRDAWELTAIVSWKVSPFLSVIDDARGHLLARDIRVSSSRFEELMHDDDEPEDA
jgi:hypothetical protein